MKISESLLWLGEYLPLAQPYIPNLYLLKRITARKPRKDLMQLAYATTTKYYNDKPGYRITLSTHSRLFNELTWEINIMPYSRIDILYYFAHELSHMVHWNHTCKRRILESVIMCVFMEKLAADGYVSEEDELGREL